LKLALVAYLAWLTGLGFGIYGFEITSLPMTLQISLLSFRTQFIVAGPGLVPWQYDPAFIAGMSDYLGIDSGVGNLTIRNWAEVNLANFPVSPTCSTRGSFGII
jgi:hypothetical protein